MADRSLLARTAASTPKPPEDGVAMQLREEYEARRALFDAQLPAVQRFLEAQAGQIATALSQQVPQVHFMLPDRVVPDAGDGRPVTVPQAEREELVGGLMDRLTGASLIATLRERLGELEESSNRGVATSAALIRYAAATYMVHSMLPAGRTVSYVAADGEEIPTIPAAAEEPASALTAPTDVIVEEEGHAAEERGELIVPYVPAARRFYLPQWVAFDDEGHLLVGSVNEAEADIASMQRYVRILHMAVYLAPYVVSDEEYKRKRYGILGQLINQGRALARYETREIIDTIQRRAAARSLNRGLSLSLPYFDDQALEMKTHDFVVIPSGRIMFVPAFVVRAAREEQAKVAQDTRLNVSTRKHLLEELKTLEGAFEAAPRA